MCIYTNLVGFYVGYFALTAFKNLSLVLFLQVLRFFIGIRTS